MPEPLSENVLFAGLRELLDSAFPKRCPNCGRVYATAAEFMAATRPLRFSTSGLKQSVDDDGNPVVELFRNCVCGSTLLESFWSRRDHSKEGALRRARFQEIADRLVEIGCTPEKARAELLKLMRGHPNDVLQLVRSRKR